MNNWTGPSRFWTAVSLRKKKKGAQVGITKRSKGTNWMLVVGRDEPLERICDYANPTGSARRTYSASRLRSTTARQHGGGPPGMGLRAVQSRWLNRTLAERLGPRRKKLERRQAQLANLGEGVSSRSIVGRWAYLVVDGVTLYRIDAKGRLWSIAVRC